MATVQLETPVHVRLMASPPPRHYRVEALFAPGLAGEHKEFDRALRACGKAIRHALGPPGGSVALLEQLSFCPALRVETLPFVLRAGKHSEELPLTTVLFDVGAHRWACLPSLDRLVIPLPADTRLASAHAIIQDAIHAHLRARREEAAPTMAELRACGAAKGDFVTTMPLSAELARGRFDFDPSEASDWLAALFQERAFDGAAELQRVAQDLGQAHPDGLQRTVLPDPRVARIAAALFGSDPIPTALVGPTGAGRTTLVHEAVAQPMDACHQDLDRLPKVWWLDPTRVIAGMAVVGAWQRRAEAIFREVTERLPRRYGLRRPDALYVDNPVALCRVGQSAGSTLTLAAVLRPWLERRGFPFLIEATPTEWQRVEELDRPFADLFQVIRVPEPDRIPAVRVLAARRAVLEAERGCRFERGALQRILELEERYPSGLARPGGLVRRLEQLAGSHPGEVITESLVDAAFRDSSRLHPRILDPVRRGFAAEVDHLLAGRLVGQPDAGAALA
ncbi:MAG: hypothetical protein ABIO70_11390, partial [Pseudomonadota bacterium]